MKINKYFKKRDKILNQRYVKLVCRKEMLDRTEQDIKNIKSDMLKLEAELIELRQFTTNLNYKKVDKDAFTTRKEGKIQEQNGET